MNTEWLKKKRTTVLLTFCLLLASLLLWMAKIKIGYQIAIALLFYLLAFNMFRCLFKGLGRCEEPRLPETPNVFKHDLAIAFLSYTVLTLMFFYPCLGQLSSCLIGPAEDNMQHFWDLWWMQQAASHQGVTLHYTNHVFYPEGTSLLFHTFSFYNIFLSLALNRIFSLVLTYNLLILSTFPIAGIGAFLLVRYLTRDSWAALAGGFIFAFNHFHFAHALHHLEIASLQFIPFYVLNVIKAMKGHARRDLLLASVFFLLNAACSWYYLNFAFNFLVLSYVYLAWRRRRVFLRDVAAKSAVIIGPTLLIFFPRAFQAITLARHYPNKVFLPGHNTYVVDLLSLLVPDPKHWLSGLNLIRWANDLIPLQEWEKTAYLGLACLLMVFWALLKRNPVPRKYYLGFFTFLILSMGMTLHVAGRPTPLILPYAVFRYIPLLKYARTASVFMAYVYLFWALLTGFSLKGILGQQRTRSLKVLVAVACLVLIVADYFTVCRDMTMAAAPKCYSAIERTDERFGVLNVPLKFGDFYMLYQTGHGLPIVNGYIGRKVGKMLRDRLELEDLFRQKEQLTESRVKYIVIHKDFLAQDPKRPVSIEEYQRHYRTLYEDDTQILLQVY